MQVKNDYGVYIKIITNKGVDLLGYILLFLNLKKTRP